MEKLYFPLLKTHANTPRLKPACAPQPRLRARSMNQLAMPRYGWVVEFKRAAPDGFPTRAFPEWKLLGIVRSERAAQECAWLAMEQYNYVRWRRTIVLDRAMRLRRYPCMMQ